jgi:hypothetical protein
MKIGFVGDSWTHAVVVDETDSYPYLIKNKLNADIIKLTRPGSTNFEIFYNSVYLIQNKLIDILIIGWSGISRVKLNMPDLYGNPVLDTKNILDIKDLNISNIKSIYTDEYNTNKNTFSLSFIIYPLKAELKFRKQFFKTHNLKYFQQKWDTELKLIEDLCLKNNIKLIHFSVFGDKPINKYPNFLDISFLEYLAEDQIGTSLKYEISIFEFDFFNHLNNKVTEEFCDRNLDSNWRLACLEREELRLDQPKKNFLNCGHPNENGHKIWADYIHKIVIRK